MQRRELLDRSWVVVYPLLPYLVVVISSLLEFRFLFNSGYIGIGDFSPPSQWYAVHGATLVLNTSYYGGAFNLSLPSAPLSIALAAFPSPGFIYRLALVSIPVIAGTSVILLCKYIFRTTHPSVLALSVAGFVYSNNPWLITEAIVTGHLLALGAAYAILPLLLLSWVYSMESGSPLSYVVSGALFAATLAVSYWMAVLLIPLLLLAPMLVLSSTSGVGGAIRRYVRGMLRILVGVLIGGLLSLYWVVPFVGYALTSSQIQLNPISQGFVVQLSQYASPLNEIRLLGYWSQPYTFLLFVPNSVILSVLYYAGSLIYVALVASIFLRSKFSWPTAGTWAFASTLYFVYLILGSGTTILGPIYVRLVYLLPFLDDPYQFVAFVVLAVSISSVPTVSRLSEYVIGTEKLSATERLNRSKFAAWRLNVTRRGISAKASRRSYNRKRKVGIVLTALLAGLLIVAVWPSFSPNMNGGYGTIPEPEAYQLAFSWLHDHAANTRTLWVPSDSPYVSFNWSGRLGYSSITDPVRWQSESPTLNYPDGSVGSPGTENFIWQIQDLLWANATSNVGALLHMAGVGFLAVRLDVLPTTYARDLLYGAFNQVDLSLRWHSGPIWIFQSKDPAAYVSAGPPVVVYGGFTTINALGWLGSGVNESTVLTPESLSYQELQYLTEDTTAPLVTLLHDSPSIIPSIAPRDAWRSLSEYANSNWSLSTAYAIPYGQSLSGQALTAQHGRLDMNLSTGRFGQYIALIQILGMIQYYNMTVLGPSTASESYPKPEIGYNWVTISNLSGLSNYTIVMNPRTSSTYSVAALVVLPTTVYRSLQDEVSLVNQEGRLVQVIPPEDLFANNALIQSYNPISTGNASPFASALRFPLVGVNLAGSAMELNITAPDTSVRVLVAASVRNTTGNGSVNFYAKRGTGYEESSIPFTVNTVQPEWVSAPWVYLPGTYFIQVEGNGFNFYGAVIESSRSASPQSCAVSRVQIHDLTVTGSVTGSSLCGITSMYSTPQLWTGYVSGEQTTLELSGVGIGVVLLTNVSRNGTTSFEFDVPLQHDTDVALTVSEITAVLVFIAAVWFLVRPRLNRGQPLGLWRRLSEFSPLRRKENLCGKVGRN
jgi:hypothetical protein